MKANKRQITIILGSILLAMMSTGCSSDESPAVPEIEYKTSAADLNDHLIHDWMLFPDGIIMYPISFKAYDAPEIDKYAYSDFNVAEIPGKGGTYDMGVGGGRILHDFKVYDNMPLLSHDYADYNYNLQGECMTYNDLIKSRQKPDMIVNLEEFNAPDCAESDKNIAFTFTFPENRTGQPRLWILSFEGVSFNLAFPSDERWLVMHFGYFIQMPD